MDDHRFHPLLQQVEVTASESGFFFRGSGQRLSNRNTYVGLPVPTGKGTNQATDVEVYQVSPAVPFHHRASSGTSTSQHAAFSYHT